MSSSLAPEDFLSVDTPENAASGYEAADIGARFLAALADSLLLQFIQLVAGAAGALLAWLVVDRLALELSSLMPWLLGLYALLSFALLCGYNVFFEITWNGQSPGKRWTGLRVIRTDGTPVTLAESLVRNLMRLIDGLPACYGLGLVTMLINRQARRLGDLAAGTLVVHDRASAPLERTNRPASDRAAPTAIPTSVAMLAASWPVDRLAEADVAMAEEFLQRRTQVVGRAALARSLLLALLRRLDVPEQAAHELEAEDVVTAIVAAYRRRRPV